MKTSAARETEAASAGVARATARGFALQPPGYPIPAVAQRRAGEGIGAVFGATAKPVQARSDAGPLDTPMHCGWAGLPTVAAPRENRTGLPNQLKAGVEQLSGLAMDDVRVHYDSPRPAQLQALAYTQGANIHVGPGQERHLPHEAWHVAQQKQGRVSATPQMKGAPINDDAALEHEADAMGNRAAQAEHAGLTAKPSFPPRGGAIQRKPVSKKANTETITLYAGKPGVYSYVINGTATQNKNGNPAPGNIRYIRTDGVGDCIAVAMQGKRADGTVVSLLAHLSGKDYFDAAHGGIAAHPQMTEAYLQVANFSQGLNGVRSIAVTTYQHPSFNIVAAMKPGLQDVPLHNVQPFRPGKVGDFILDTEQFDLHKAMAADELRGAELGGSVSEAMTQLAFFEKYPPPKKDNPRSGLLLMWILVALFIAWVFDLLPASSKAEPASKDPPGS